MGLYLYYTLDVDTYILATRASHLDVLADIAIIMYIMIYVVNIFRVKNMTTERSALQFFRCLPCVDKHYSVQKLEQKKKILFIFIPCNKKYVMYDVSELCSAREHADLGPSSAIFEARILCRLLLSQNILIAIF